MPAMTVAPESEVEMKSSRNEVSNIIRLLLYYQSVGRLQLVCRLFSYKTFMLSGFYGCMPMIKLGAL